jgi:hypothetical protein
MIKAVLLLFALFIAQGIFWAPTQNRIVEQNIKNKIDGVTLVAPPQPFPTDPIVEVKEIGAGWITCVPYGFVRFGSNDIRYNLDFQWWGERKEGIEKTISYAHSSDVKVMLKPQIWSPDGWIGDYTLTSEKEWKKWEDELTEYILYYAQLAADNNVELFCLGTEMKAHKAARPNFFKNLIPKIKEIYCGKLTYSSNWDNYKSVNFWDQLDYIGLSAYFPLNEKDTPEVNYLVNQWKPVEKELAKYSKELGKPILFTEYGYLSVDGSGGKTWLLEKKVRRLPINEVAQANCFKALYQVFGEKDYWAGGFIWKWFPHGKGGEGYNERDYTPQGKEASEVIKRYYSKW